ncbi:MAG: GMC family oxidoreductase [Chloroflexota bacterium]
MPFLNANQIDSNAYLHADVCIIGSGAAGIAVAQKLNQTKLKVIILEAGGLKYEEDLQRDYRYLFPNWFRGEWAATRTRAVGGTTIAWYGRCTQMEPIDFEKREWVQNSGWPIDCQSIDQYKKEALEFLHVPEAAGIDPDFWGYNVSREAFRNGELEPRNFIWSNPTDMTTVHGAWLRDSPNISLYYYAFAQEIDPSPSNDHIDSVHVKNLNGDRFQIKASKVILAGGTVENCRLLLLSQKNSAQGVGNDHDNVGRYYMDHPRIEGESYIRINKALPNWENVYRHLDETETTHGVLQFFLAMSEEFQRQHKLLNHCTMLRPVFYEKRSNSYLAAKRIYHAAKGRNLSDLHKTDALKAAYGFGKLVKTGIKQVIGTPLTVSHMELIDQLEQEPNPNSRVTLSQQKDRFNQPLAHIDWQIDESTTYSLRKFHQLIDKHLKANNLGKLTSPHLEIPDHVADYTDACHPAGTTRMSDMPQDGVVDKNCAVHGFDNLFIAGGSVFPTSGHENPTLTIVALALRLAEHIKTLSRTKESRAVAMK